MLGETVAVRMAGGIPNESMTEELFLSQEQKNAATKIRTERRRECKLCEPKGSP
jgi:hypothetical protein